MENLPFHFKKDPVGIVLDVSLDLTSILRQEEQLQMGITAIIQTKDGRESYWALAHPAPYADFHLRESFILAPEGQTPPLGRSAQHG